ncbi:MAG TPA: hypothetical protein PK771_12685 [Spirochaetota bacterium]|nr:hypothetical protein [Spirochaetota bacterium]
MLQDEEIRLKCLEIAVNFLLNKKEVVKNDATGEKYTTEAYLKVDNLTKLLFNLADDFQCYVKKGNPFGSDI